MMMINKSKNNYDKLLELHAPKSLGEITAIDAGFKINNSDVILGRSFHGALHCLLINPKIPASEEKPLAHGFTVAVKPLVNPLTGDESIFLDLKAMPGVDIYLFAAIVDEIGRITIKNKDVLLEIEKIIKKWGFLLSQPGIKQFGRIAAIGLFGELLVLKNLLECRNVDEVMEGWLGPLGSIHDFELLDLSVEVKTQLSHSNLIHINGENQLANVDDKPLELVVVRIMLDENGKNLNEYIEKIKTAAPAFKFLFQEKLISIGYTPENELASKLRIGISEALLFKVGPDFPKITPPSLSVLGLNGQVSDLSYKVAFDENQVTFSSKGCVNLWQ